MVETSLSQFHPEYQASTAPVRNCLDSCRKELKALNILVADLASCGQNATGRRDKIKSRGKKLLYPFNRPKIEQLETRLCNANSTLQLALQALGL